MVNSASQGLISFTNNRPTFNDPGDGFGKYRVGVSPNIPSQLIDSSRISGSDTRGIIDEATNKEEFFGITDTENDDNTGLVDAVWSFNVSGYSDLRLSVDIGAMGDFEVL